MINLEWKGRDKSDLIALRTHLSKIEKLAKENEECFYVTIPFFVYDLVIKTGINAKVDIMERERNSPSGDIVVVRILRK